MTLSAVLIVIFIFSTVGQSDSGAESFLSMESQVIQLPNSAKVRQKVIIFDSMSLSFDFKKTSRYYPVAYINDLLFERRKRETRFDGGCAFYVTLLASKNI